MTAVAEPDYVGDAMWRSARAQDLVRSRDFGGLIRLARTMRGWRQADLGRAVHASASTVSRVETGLHSPDFRLMQELAVAVDMPDAVFGAVLGVIIPSRTKVASFAATPCDEEEDPMRRRTLLAAAGHAIPIGMFTPLDDALAAVPASHGPVGAEDLADAFGRARGLFDQGRHGELVAVLPDLLAVAHTAGEDRTMPDELRFARLSTCYDLATEALTKVGRYDAARITADRSTVFANLSGSPLAAASAARMLSIVLRHQGGEATAHKVTVTAAANVAATGLTTSAQAACYAQMLCTAAYTSATHGDRGGALELITEAERAVRNLPTRSSNDQRFISPAGVALYKVGVLNQLGDAGAALHAGRDLRAADFPTAERRCRMFTDLARSWWQWGKPEPTARALLNAYQHAPGEVLDRPAIRAIGAELGRRHASIPEVRRLTALLRHRS